MNTIKEYVTAFFQNPVGNDLLLPAILFCSIILLLLIWFLTRDVRLWYWKVNKQISALNSIDTKLQELGGSIAAAPALVQEPEEAEMMLAEALDSGTHSESNVKKVFTEEELEELIRE